MAMKSWSMQVTTNWNQKMEFSALGDSGHKILMDALPEVGGEDKGVRPKELLLTSLTGCTAMDVISILRKMKNEPQEFRVEANAQLTEEHPKVFSQVHVRYFVKGKVDEEKLKRAINLSQEKYCGVSAMFRQICPLTYDYQIEL